MSANDLERGVPLRRRRRRGAAQETLLSTVEEDDDGAGSTRRKKRALPDPTFDLPRRGAAAGVPQQVEQPDRGTTTPVAAFELEKRGITAKERQRRRSISFAQSSEDSVIQGTPSSSTFVALQKRRVREGRKQEDSSSSELGLLSGVEDGSRSGRSSRLRPHGREASVQGE
jgi:hypothetical protein